MAKPERVVGALLKTLVAAALDVVRHRDRGAAVQKHLQDLVVVALGCITMIALKGLFRSMDLFYHAILM